MNTVHISVLPDEVVHWLNPQPGQVIVDGTLGGGGHAREIAKRLGPTGQLIGLDRDPAALDRCQSLAALASVTLLHANFGKLTLVLESLQLPAIDGLLLDLGLSSDQLADATRGFSFEADGPLDLRFDLERGESAVELIRRLSAQDLANLIYEYGEERFSRRIAPALQQAVATEPTLTAKQAARVIARCYPAGPPGSRSRIHPATRTFQALRIAVNGELDALKQVLTDLPQLVRPGGRVVIISFHSLEDRLVKQAFALPAWNNLTRKPVTASDGELNTNPRSRSAKLRAAERRAE